MNVIAYEYKGYGITKGSPSAKSVKKDMVIVYRFLREILGIPACNIVLFGRSIGMFVTSFSR